MFTTKDPNIILGCGLWGIINVKKSKFDKTLFNVLGINNDSRGGDSCGIFIDGNYEYGIKEKKLYANFVKDSELIKNTKTCKIAIGHCRKASVGTITEDTAQPVILKNNEGNVEFVVIHNGTIYNYRALAAKYIPDINITGMTDSQVMARIFYHKGYDVLSEYYGGAVFIIVDYREKEPKVLCFKGASKNSSASPTMTEERPLKFIHTDNSFIFSSIGDYLTASNPEEIIYTPIANQLVEVRGDDIYLVQEVDRSQVAQTLPSNNKSYYYGYKYYEDDFYDWDNYNKKQITHTETSKTETKKETTQQRVSLTNDGIYHINNIPLHGSYCLDSWGVVYDKCHTEKIIKLWFWDGVLLYGNPEFLYLKNCCKQWDITKEDVKYVLAEILNYLSPYPISDPDYVGGNDPVYCYKCKNMNDLEPYTGEIHRFGTFKSSYYLNGIHQHDRWHQTREDAFENLKKVIKETPVDLSTLYKQLYS